MVKLSSFGEYVHYRAGWCICTVPAWRFKEIGLPGA